MVFDAGILKILQLHVRTHTHLICTHVSYSHDKGREQVFVERLRRVKTRSYMQQS